MQNQGGNLLRRKQVLLAPSDAWIPAAFRKVTEAWDLHRMLLHDMQRLRGRVYLADGALQPYELTIDGRHESPLDNESWHLLSLDENGRVGGCVRYRMFSSRVRYEQLTVSRTALAKSPQWGPRLRACVEAQMDSARKSNVPFVEVGGWALSEALRGSTEAVRTALGSFALGQLFGGAVGITTATVRNHSSSILSRIGGQDLFFGGASVPGYFEPQYGCDMKILAFESTSYDPRHHDRVMQIAGQLAMAPVYSNGADWRAAGKVHPRVYSLAHSASI